MAFYQFVREQHLLATSRELWDFMSSPHNLARITPSEMEFRITSEVSGKIYPGMIISYAVKPLMGIKTTWVTEITHVEEGKFFIDEQRVGPYKLWHHQHLLKPTEEGTIMKDIVSYQPPFGFVGSIANGMVIRKKLEEIFEYRYQVLDSMFGSVSQENPS